MEFNRPKGGFGVIHKACKVEYMGKKGTLIWDYIIWNEITFVDDYSQEKISLFTSISDKETEKRFEEISKKYSPKAENSDGSDEDTMDDESLSDDFSKEFPEE